MGLENIQNFSNLHARVTPASQNIAHSFDAGHTVSISVGTSDGYMINHEVIVRVPQIHGFELTEPMAKVLQSLGIARGMVVSGCAGDGRMDELSTLGDNSIAEFYQDRGFATATRIPIYRLKGNL